MAHPFQEHRQSKVEHSRVGSLTKGYASGGAVHSDAAQDRKLIKKMMAQHEREEGEDMGGKQPKNRLDRPSRASGGRVKGATVNINISPRADPSPPNPLAAAGMPLPPPGGMPALPPGPPPIPPGPPPGGPPMKPPGIMSSGGRAYARGGGVKSGPAYEEGKREGTQVTHSGNKNDGKDVGRGKPVTYATGGPINAPAGKKGMGPKFGGGGRGGLARLQKAARAKAAR
jgi:hypothetical protein